MAISFVAESHSPGYSTAYIASVTINKPTGTTTNDLMLMVCGGTPSTPSGWTRLGALVDSGTSSMLDVGVFYKVAGGSEPSSYTVSCSTSWSQAASISTYRGCDTATPVDTTDFDISACSGTNYNVGPVTATATQWAYSFACDYTFSGATHTYTEGSGTERVDHGNTNSDPASAAFMSCDSNGTVSAGSFSRTQTCGISTSGGVAGLVLLNPAGTGAANAPADDATATAAAYNATAAAGISVSAGRAQATAAGSMPTVIMGFLVHPGLATATAAIKDVGRLAHPSSAVASAAVNSIERIFTGTPNARTYHVEAEDRTLDVPYETRSFSVPAEAPGS